MVQPLEQTLGITEQEIRGTNKQIKRALTGFFGGFIWTQREIPKMEAACLLVRRRIANNCSQAKQILDNIVGETRIYGKKGSLFDFRESESGDSYQIYVTLYWF